MKLLLQVTAACTAAALTTATMFAQGGCTDPLLWDNGSPDGSSAWSNFIDACFPIGADRTMLDDFAVTDSGWDVSCFEWHHIWYAATPPFGTGATFSLLKDSNGIPGSPIGPLNITAYTETPTGNTYFSRPEAISTIGFDVVSLDPGKYWFEGAICGNDANYWLMHDTILCSECWVNYSDLGGLQPGSQVHGIKKDMSWRLFGNVRDDRIVKYCNPADGHTNNTSGIDLSGNILSQSIEVCLTGGPPNQFAYLLIGNNDGIVNQPPGAKGDLCVVGGTCIGRYALDVGVIDSAGSLCIDIEASASGGPNYGIPTCGGNIQPGDTWYFQYWHRQPMGQPSTFSEAARVSFKQ